MRSARLNQPSAKQQTADGAPGARAEMLPHFAAIDQMHGGHPHLRGQTQIRRTHDPEPRQQFPQQREHDQRDGALERRRETGAPLTYAGARTSRTRTDEDRHDTLLLRHLMPPSMKARLARARVHASGSPMHADATRRMPGYAVSMHHADAADRRRVYPSRVPACVP